MAPDITRDARPLRIGTELSKPEDDDPGFELRDDADHFTDVNGDGRDIVEDEDDEEDLKTIGDVCLPVLIASGGEITPVWPFIDPRRPDVCPRLEWALEPEKLLVVFFKEKLLCTCVAGFGVTEVARLVRDRIFPLNSEVDLNRLRRFTGLIFSLALFSTWVPISIC